MTDPIQAEYFESPEQRIARLGHRAFVGGQDAELWYSIGKLQYHFLVSRGLRPCHRFLDVACGSLRLGQYLIPYLEKGQYFGLEGQSDLVKLGLANEFYADIIRYKSPTFGFNYDFDFSFAGSFDVGIAQSLFTHLTIDAIDTCFRNLRSIASARSQFFFTFFEGNSVHNPPGDSHDQLVWRYNFSDLKARAEAAGWFVDYIGNWQHPRGQMMAVAVPR